MGPGRAVSAVGPPGAVGSRTSGGTGEPAFEFLPRNRRIPATPRHARTVSNVRSLRKWSGPALLLVLLTGSWAGSTAPADAQIPTSSTTTTRPESTTTTTRRTTTTTRPIVTTATTRPS